VPEEWEVDLQGSASAHNVGMKHQKLRVSLAATLNVLNVVFRSVVQIKFKGGKINGIIMCPQS